MRYKAIADQIISDIEQGTRVAGTRMPPLRALTKLYGVSMTTALNSYRLLEELGWIIAKPQSGFYVTQPLSDQKTPKPPLFRSHLTDPNRGHASPPAIAPSVIHPGPGPLRISQMSPSLMPTDALQRSLKRGIQRLGRRLHEYPDRQGEITLRQALEQHFLGYGFPFSADELVITNGCMDAVRVALEATTQRGDAVAISSPCFSGLLELLAGLSRKVIEIPYTDDGIELAQLEQHLKDGTVKAGLFSTSHMNPQGTSLSPAQKQALAALASQYRTPIIEDDVYMELGYDKVAPLPAKHWDSDGYILWCGSVSKTLTAGYRVGWCLPGRYLPDVVRRTEFSHFGVNSPVQMGLADFIATGQYHSHLQKTRLRLAHHMRQYRNALAGLLPADAAFSNPTGGMVLWVQVPGLNTHELLKAARQNDISIRIGSHFSTLPLYRDCFRINTGWPLEEDTEEHQVASRHLHRVAELVNSQLQQGETQ
ncbi:PLP-dependent aminotransferase family protein [Saccharospirillum impatiens]|uniref:aminotransferase-like domain-containing protein n=1 Tax=Saccharospirillum impatiens TaxID=169438 RepID=UPI0004252DF9|nr:PLP-dependent aminotransferase family protein [Saccharospirillum impatiens]